MSRQANIDLLIRAGYSKAEAVRIVDEPVTAESESAASERLRKSVSQWDGRYGYDPGSNGHRK